MSLEILKQFSRADFSFFFTRQVGFAVRFILRDLSSLILTLDAQRTPIT